MVIHTLHDPGLFYKDGAFWMIGGGVRPSATGYEYAPILGYSTDLVNWSFPSPGKDYLETGLTPTLAPLDKDGNRIPNARFDGVAIDGFADDDGAVWMTVTLGHYADNASNRLSQYLIKATGLKAPGDSTKMGTEAQKMQNSIFDVTYGDLTPINLPLARYGLDGEDHDGREYEYDGSLFKDNGKYYLIVQHSGSEIQLWQIDDLNNAANPDAWTLVNAKMTEGSEGPSVTKNNGKYYMYTDRFFDWPHGDEWEDAYGIFAFTNDRLDQTFNELARIKTVDSVGNSVSARHGTVITLNDENAKTVALSRYNALYRTTK